MFEHRSEPLLSKREFMARLLRHGGIALGIVLGSLGLGMAGYHLTEEMRWIDAMLNSAMLLGGMGPVNELHTAAGKIFASAYALFAGLVFLIVVGIMLAPAVHRLIHRFHLDSESERPNGDSSA